MRAKRPALQFLGFLIVFSGFLMSQSWELPKGKVKENGSRMYRFTIDYCTSDTKGRMIDRQQVKADYTRGLPGSKAVWKNVTITESVNGDKLGPAREREFMNGFQYTRDASFNPLSPDFFKSFPADAVMERNLVWDTVMFEAFGQEQLEHLRLNQVYHPSGDPRIEHIDMPGVGTFRNRDIQLMWTGRSLRNGQECALIEYQAYFNPLEMTVGGMNLIGRSHYWGQIWVSLATRQIEYATLYEDVLGEITFPGMDSPKVIDVFRSGVFQPLAKN
jgi:hypothetical protein